MSAGIVTKPDDSAVANEHLATLLARVGIGDRRAFAELYEATKSKLFGVSVRIVGERHLAEEVLQDSFVSIWHHAASYAAAKSAPMTWMTTIVRNRSLDLQRRAHRLVQDEDDALALGLADLSPAPDEALALARNEARVHHCLRGLVGEQQKAITLAFFHGLSHAEVAAAMKKPLGTVKTNVRRGLLKLRACIDRQGGAEGADFAPTESTR